MRLFASLLLLSFVLTVLAPLRAGTANACSCVGLDAEESIAISRTVATGQLEGWQIVGNHQVASISVDRYLLGTGPVELEVSAGPDCAAYGEETVGSEVLVLVYKETPPSADPNYGATSACVGSGPIADGYPTLGFLEDLEAILGEGSPPIENSDSGGGPPAALIVPLALAIPIAVLAFPTFVSRRS